MTTHSMTTIKVPKLLRERLSREAARTGRTAAAVIDELLDEKERQARFAAVHLAYSTQDSAYAAELAAWDALAEDGLEP